MMFKEFFTTAFKRYQAMALLKAIDLDDETWGESLLQKGAPVNARNEETGQTLLLYAIHGKNEKFTRLLLKYGADVNAADKQGDTALHYAVRVDAPHILKLLLAYQAVPMKNAFDNYPLDLAAMYNKTQSTEILMKIADMDGLKRAWNYAKASKSTKTSDLLLPEYFMREAGEDVEKRMEDGRTYLTAAIEENEMTLAKRLIEAGAGMHTQDANGETPLDVAKRVHSPMLDYFTKIYEQEEAVAQKVLKAYGATGDIDFKTLVVQATAPLNHNKNLLEKERE